MIHKIKAVILAGGRGTRFHPFSFIIPKPLMPVGESPILLHLINQLRKSEVSDFLLATGYQSELIVAYLGDGKKLGVDIKYFKEELQLGTAGPLSLMRNQFAKDEYFFLANGDIYTEMVFSDMLEFAVRGSFDMVVGFIERRERSSFGVMEVESDVILKIVEKPERVSLVSAGIYVINSRALARIPDAEFFTMPDLIESYLSEGSRVGAYKITDFWMGIEDVESIDKVIKRTESILGT